MVLWKSRVAVEEDRSHQLGVCNADEGESHRHAEKVTHFSLAPEMEKVVDSVILFLWVKAQINL